MSRDEEFWKYCHAGDYKNVAMQNMRKKAEWRNRLDINKFLETKKKNSNNPCPCAVFAGTLWPRYHTFDNKLLSVFNDWVLKAHILAKAGLNVAKNAVAKGATLQDKKLMLKFFNKPGNGRYNAVIKNLYLSKCVFENFPAKLFYRGDSSVHLKNSDLESDKDMAKFHLPGYIKKLKKEKNELEAHFASKALKNGLLYYLPVQRNDEFFNNCVGSANRGSEKSEIAIGGGALSIALKLRHKKDEKQLFKMAGMILHEITHAYCYTLDHYTNDGWVAYDEKCLQLAQNSLWKAWDNADNYTFFCICSFARGKTFARGKILDDWARGLLS